MTFGGYISAASLGSGGHLRAARALAGLTQQQLAAESGLHRNSVKLWENRRDRIAGFAVSAMLKTLASHGVEAIEERDPAGNSIAVVRRSTPPKIKTNESTHSLSG